MVNGEDQTGMLQLKSRSLHAGSRQSVMQKGVKYIHCKMLVHSNITI